MVVIICNSDEQYDWTKEVQQFDQTKAGVKGLIDAGVQKLPKFFVHQPQSFTTPELAKTSTDLDLSTIDFQGGVKIDNVRRREVMEEISKAAQDWRFMPSSRAMEKPLAPIEEILSEENPVLYREFMFTEYIEYYKRTGQGDVDALPHFRINNH